ncbi:MAG: hypothetical protein L3J00_09350 [Thiomicrorhabdus sp.]|nr:hypothetical protein [Thiomicrorhabdus sp.]
MDIKAWRDESGQFQLEMGPVIFNLPEEAIEGIRQVINQRLHHSSELDEAGGRRKIKAYRILASKMANVDDRIVQKFAAQVLPEQLVTIVRLAEDDALYKKVLKNLSKQNRRQFEEDYQAMDKISEHHACLHMEQVITLIRRAAEEQKSLSRFPDKNAN